MGEPSIAAPGGEVRDLRVTISIGGPFPSPLHLAAFLERQGLLERMISFMPRFRLKWAGVSDARLLRLWPLGVAASAARQIPLVRTHVPYNWHISEWFDRLAAERLGDCTLFNGWCATSLHSLRRAKARGIVTALQMGSAHLAWQTRVLQEEDDRYGVRRPPTDPRFIEKASSEYAEADHLIVASSFVRRTLVENGIDPSRISMVHDALTRSFTAAPKRDDVFRVLFVGRLELRKGVQYLLEAIRRLKLPRAELVLVGGPQADMAGVLKEYSGTYTSVGFASEGALGEAFGQASVCVVPSVEDGWCHVTQEAMSCGLPVIVTENVGSADIVKPGINGYVVPARDVESLMEKIELLYGDEQRRRAMGQAARQGVQSRTWPTYGQEMLDVFNTIMADARRR